VVTVLVGAHQLTYEFIVKVINCQKREKKIRLERIMDRESRNMGNNPYGSRNIHGSVRGIVNLADMVNRVAEGGANAVLLQKGMAKHGHRGYGRDIGLIIHMSASTSLGPDPNDKVQVCTVEEAIKMGADAVSVHVNIGSETEAKQLKKLGDVAEYCDIWGMPLIAMMYPRGKDIKNSNEAELVAHVARVVRIRRRYHKDEFYRRH